MSDGRGSASTFGASSQRAPCTGAILAGGASKRMQQTKQEMLLPDGRPMIESVHRAVAAVCRRVVLIGESSHLRDCERVGDLRASCGPLGGIEALLASGIDQHYLVVPCDLPLITAEPLDALLMKADRPATTFDGHPLPARIAATALPIVRSLLDRGERSVRRLMADAGAERIALRDEWCKLLTNVNTPADVQQIDRERSRVTGAGD